MVIHQLKKNAGSKEYDVKHFNRNMTDYTYLERRKCILKTQNLHNKTNYLYRQHLTYDGNLLMCKYDL